MTVQVTGMGEAKKALAQLERKNQEAFSRGMLKSGLTLQAASQKLVPVDTGALRSSAYTKLNGIDVGGGEGAGAIAKAIGAVKSLIGRAVRALGFRSSPRVTVEVGYTQSYGIYVHEDLTANHPNGGQAKYLEQPAREMESQLFAIVKNEVDDANRL